MYEGGYAKAAGAQYIASTRLLCLKVIQRDHLKYMFTGDTVLNKLEVHKRLASSMPCPAPNFPTGLELCSANIEFYGEWLRENWCGGACSLNLQKVVRTGFEPKEYKGIPLVVLRTGTKGIS